jgi:hypothetical protein
MSEEKREYAVGSVWTWCPASDGAESFADAAWELARRGSQHRYANVAIVEVGADRCSIICTRSKLLTTISLHGLRESYAEKVSPQLREGQVWQTSEGWTWCITGVAADRVDYVREEPEGERPWACTGRPRWHVTEFMKLVSDVAHESAAPVTINFNTPVVTAEPASSLGKQIAQVVERSRRLSGGIVFHGASIPIVGNATCPRCNGPAYLGLQQSTCLRSGGCKTAEERVEMRLPRVFVDIADRFIAAPPDDDGLHRMEVVHCIGPTSSMHANHVAHDLEHPTYEGVLALWRSRALAEERGR